MSQMRRIPSRADGIANREKLLDAAETYFAHNGLDAPLHGVAELAGVGAGTLYRNFASQDDLIEALFDRIDSTFDKLASTASAQRTGWLCLEVFLRQTVTFLVENPATGEIIRRYADKNPENGPEGRSWFDPLEEFVAQAKAEGSARPDLTSQDLAAAPLALGSLQNFSPEERTEIAARMVTLMLDGMRAHPHAPTTLPVGASRI